MECRYVPARTRRQAFGEQTLHILADKTVQKHIFIREMQVEGSPVNVRSLGNILNAGGGKSLLLYNFSKCLLQHLPCTFNTTVHAFSGGCHCTCSSLACRF